MLERDMLDQCQLHIIILLGFRRNAEKIVAFLLRKRGVQPSGARFSVEL